MKQFITDSKYAYYWAMRFGDREHMKQYVTTSHAAYWWARNIGDIEYMRQFVTEHYYMKEWTIAIDADFRMLESLHSLITQP